MWTNSQEDITHFVYREGIFAPVDAVHLMKVYLIYHILLCPLLKKEGHIAPSTLTLCN